MMPVEHLDAQLGIIHQKELMIDFDMIKERLLD